MRALVENEVSFMQTSDKSVLANSGFHLESFSFSFQFSDDLKVNDKHFQFDISDQMLSVESVDRVCKLMRKEHRLNQADTGDIFSLPLVDGNENRVYERGKFAVQF